jgi:hypothetical protein
MQKIYKSHVWTSAIVVNISVFISAILTSKSVTEFKDEEMGRACGTHIEEEECKKDLGERATKQVTAR